MFLIDHLVCTSGLQVCEIPVIPRAGDDVDLGGNGSDEFHDGASSGGIWNRNHRGGGGSDADVFEHISMHRVTNVPGKLKLLRPVNHTWIEINHGDPICQTRERLSDGLAGWPESNDMMK